LGNDGSLLYKTGFWNALNYVLSSGAIAKIRDLGTFYHLMPENPSGSEWTIFWLRLFRSDAQLSTVDHEKGVRIVVDRLEVKLEEIGKPDVDLRKDATVTRVGPGEMLGHKVRLTVESAQLAEDDFDFDHVILALPQWPLQRLASSFPINIRKHIEGVIAFPLLKAFVVTENPWWDEHTPSQHGAHLVPTRELHYHWREGENNSDPLGMLMLYTDRPANGYWMPYVRKPHTQAQKEERGALRNELARHVLFALYRHDENTKKKRTASEIAKAQDISLPRGANETAQMEKAQKLAAERVKGAQPGMEEVARATLRSDKAIEIFEGSEGEPSDRARELVNMPAEEAIKDINETIRICAIRDWTQPPFGAGCHAWAPGVCVPEALRGLKAFSLQGPEGFPNLHVCGEAYSDYQGFIEGALKSADLVIETILP
jgi:hypothetical protein